MRACKIVAFSAVILLITILFAGVATVPTAAQTATAQPTTMQFRYNAAHTGDYSPVAGATPPNGQLKWSYATGNFVDSSPAVANGILYIGSGDDNIYALNITTGRKLWSYATANGVDSPPLSPTVSSMQEAITTTSTPSTPLPVGSSGATRPETTWSPHPPSPTAFSM